jgi:hypothetical protein
MSSSLSNFNFVKPKSSQMVTVITLLIVISFLVYLSWSGVTKIDTCLASEKSKSLNQDHLDSLNRNKKISGFSVGLNIGMLSMALIPSALLTTKSMVLLGGVIIALVSTAISSHGNLSDDCKTTIESYNNRLYGYLGFGVGIFVWIGLKNTLSVMNRVTLSTRILIGFALLNSLVLTWANWNTADNCSGLSAKARKEMDSFKKTNQIMFGLCLLFLGLLAASFVYLPV